MNRLEIAFINVFSPYKVYHPKAEEVLAVFDKETGMFNAMKP